MKTDNKVIKDAVEGKEPERTKGKFREFYTKSKKLVLAGKNAKNNEELIKQVGKDEDILHTAKPGSPFANIKGKANKSDIEQTAVFCASKSQDWRDNNSNVEVHVFKGKDVYKRKGMKLGTFGVKKFKVINVKKQDIQKLINMEGEGNLRASKEMS